MPPKREASSPPASPQTIKKYSASPAESPPPSSPAPSSTSSDEEDEDALTYHVFLTTYLAHHKRFINEVEVPSGVFATCKEANAEAISLVGDRHCNCADPNDRTVGYSHICSNVTTDTDGCITVSYESADGGFRIEAMVVAMEEAAGEVWVLKVAGVVRENAAFGGRIAAVKAMRRELKALREIVKVRGVTTGEQGTKVVAYAIVNDGLEIEAIKADHSREVIAKAEMWDLRH